MPTLASYIGYLKRTRAKMADVGSFYREHALGWKELARQVALQILLAGRPADIAEDDWRRTADYTASRVGAQLISGDGVGVAIFLAQKSGRTFEGEFANILAGEVTLEEIADYVQAGRDGDPFGKTDIDERDTGKSNAQIAMNILWAIQQGTAGERFAAIREFLGHRLSEAVAALLPAILAAWKEVFVPRAARDWKEWWGKAEI